MPEQSRITTLRYGELFVFVGVVRDHDSIEVKGDVAFFYLVPAKKSSWGLAGKASCRWMAHYVKPSTPDKHVFYGESSMAKSEPTASGGTPRFSH